MSNCGPDIVKYFIVTPLTGDTYVIGGVNTPATNNTNSALINLIYNQGVPFGTYSLPYTDVYVTGGTFSNDILSLRRNDGISIPITGFSSSPTIDTYVTGITYSNNNIIVGRNQGQSPLTTNIFTMTGLTVNGNLTVTGNTSMEGVTASTLNLSTTPANDSTNNNVLVRDVLTGVVKQRDITNALNKNYASFYDTGDQTGIAGTELTMSANTSDSWNTGITLSANTRFVIQNPGVYSLAFSAQMLKTGGNSSTHAHIWLYQNGLDVPNSASQIGFPSNSVYVVPAWNFFFSTTTPNEYVELKWEINSNVDNQLLLKQQPAFGNVPSIPSLIVTINQVN